MPTEDGDPVRTRVPRDKVAVDDEHVRLVEQLVDARLVTVDGDSVQIAHEALVRVWPRLRGWLDDDVDGQRLFRHLAGAADAWDAMGRPDSELYRGARLSPHPGVAGPRPARPQRHRDGLPRGLGGARRRSPRCPRRRGSGASAGSTAGCAARWPASPSWPCLALVAGVLAVRSSDRAEGDRDRARAAADLADARTGGAVALEHEDLSLSLLLGTVGLRGRRLRAQAWDNLAAVLPRSPSLLSVRWRRRCDRRPDGQSRRRVARGEPAGGRQGSAAAGRRDLSSQCRSTTTPGQRRSPSPRTAACWRWR